jgi:hypothetical protein
MPTFVYIGAVLPETVRVSSRAIAVSLSAAADYPATTINLQIVDNRVVASCQVDSDLSDVACATLRNIVKDVASSVCDSVAIVQGAWTVVTIDTCLNPNGTVRARFSNASPSLKRAFARNAVSSDDIVRINLHKDGYSLRLALDDINSGLMEPKFMRSHFYRAVEALRVSSSPPGSSTSGANAWETFRNATGVERAQIEILANHAERHGDYGNANPMSNADVDAAVEAMASIMGRYIAWFKRTKLENNAA